MNLLKTFFVLLLGACFLASCSYSSEYPIEEKGLPIKTELLGKWIQDTVQHASYIVFEKNNDTQYNVNRYFWSEQDSNYTTTTQLGHLSDLGGTLFLNLQNEGTYTFCKVEITPTQLKMYNVTDNIDEQFGSSAELRDFFLKNKDHSFFYNKWEETYSREVQKPQ